MIDTGLFTDAPAMGGSGGRSAFMAVAVQAFVHTMANLAINITLAQHQAVIDGVKHFQQHVDDTLGIAVHKDVLTRMAAEREASRAKLKREFRQL